MIRLIKRVKKSLTIKIFLLTSVILFAACFITYGFIAYFMPQTYSGSLNKEIDKNAAILVEELKETNFDSRNTLLETFFRDNRIMSLVLLDEYGNVVSVVSDESSKVKEGEESIQVSSDVSISTHTPDEEQEGTAYEKVQEDVSPTGIAVSTEGIYKSYITVETSVVTDKNQYEVTFKDKKGTYNLNILGAMEAVNQAVEAMNRIFPWLLLCIVLVSMLGAFLCSRYITRPVVRISRISKKMSELELDWHCEEDRSDELGDLSKSLNQLSRKLSKTLTELQEANLSLQEDMEKERLQEQQRLEFFSAVSHELKTPITIIKGQLEGMSHNIGVYKNRNKYLARSYEVACTMEGMVQELLTVSRMVSPGTFLHLEQVPLEELVMESIQRHEDLCIQKDMLMEQAIESVSQVKGDRKLLQKAIDNIMSNAIYYSPPENKITIELTEKEGKVCLKVENTGVHLPEDSISKLFQAFYRAEQSRNRNTGGSGLGLYIVKMILDMHNSKCQIQNTKEGVQFVMSFSPQYEAG